MSLANKRSFEGTLAGEEEKVFDIPVRKIVLINDGASSLTFKLNPSEDYSTLKGKEVLQIEDVRVNSVWLNGAVPYRLWGLG